MVRERKLIKCLAEAEDNTIAFGKVGSIHVNRLGGTCHSSGGLALPCGDELETSLWAGIEPFRRVTNGQCKEIGMFFWGVRNGVCEHVDLRKGGLSTPRTEEDVKWIEIARTSPRQLWWPAFLKPCMVWELSVSSICWTMRKLSEYFFSLFLYTKAAIFGMKYEFWKQADKWRKKKKTNHQV